MEKDIKKQLDRIEGTLESLANFTMTNLERLDERTEAIDKDIQDMREEVGRDLRNVKLDLLDKLAPKDKVHDHELRIQALETDVV